MHSLICSLSPHLGASSKFQERADPVSTVEKLNGSEDTLCRAWQLCGDIHCLSTKLSDSFSANLEDFQSMNPEDSTITKLAQSVLDFSGGKKLHLGGIQHTSCMQSCMQTPVYYLSIVCINYFAHFYKIRI